MNRPTDRFIGIGAGSNPNDCSVVTADGNVVSMAGESGQGIPREEATDWTDLCEYGMNWWAERAEQMSYINEDLPSPYDDPALEPLLGMVRPKVVK